MAEPDPNTVHVMPRFDLVPHRCSKECECGPRVEQTDEGTIVVHNAWDGRA